MVFETFKVISSILIVSVTLSENNGRAITPIQGWRSWNQFQGAISQDIMQSAMIALSSKSRLVDGIPTSFADLGYNDAGIDDNWQDCSGGTGGYTYHDAITGRPAVNTQTFPLIELQERLIVFFEVLCRVIIIMIPNLLKETREMEKKNEFCPCYLLFKVSKYMLCQLTI
jgi:hypothetical protein